MVDKAIPLSMMFDFVFGIILLVAVLSNAKAINELVIGMSNALATGVRAVKA